MTFFKIEKPTLGVPVIKFFFKSRRCQRRPLPHVSKRTSLVIFLKLDLEFGFFFLNELLSYKTPFHPSRAIFFLKNTKKNDTI